MVDYADPFTKKLLQPGQQQSVGVVTPDAFHVLGKILDQVSGRGSKSGLQLTKIKMVQLSELQVSHSLQAALDASECPGV